MFTYQGLALSIPYAYRAHRCEHKICAWCENCWMFCTTFFVAFIFAMMTHVHYCLRDTSFQNYIFSLKLLHNNFPNEAEKTINFKLSFVEIFIRSTYCSLNKMFCSVEQRITNHHSVLPFPLLSNTKWQMKLPWRLTFYSPGFCSVLANPS